MFNPFKKRKKKLLCENVKLGSCLTLDDMLVSTEIIYEAMYQIDSTKPVIHTKSIWTSNQDLVMLVNSRVTVEKKLEALRPAL